mgnify:CR=1 FL=1
MKGALLAALALAAAAAATPVIPQEQMPALSPVCDAPSADIATPAPLPRLTQRLEAKQQLRILAIGSSSTWGVGATSHRKTYPSQLQAILQSALKGARANIVNRGVSGEIAQTTAERLRTEVAIERPDVVLWQVGTNDALARVPAHDFERTVASTIEWLKENNIDVVIVGLQYTPKFARDDHYFAIREALRRAAPGENRHPQQNREAERAHAVRARASAHGCGSAASRRHRADGHIGATLRRLGREIGRAHV